MFGRSDTRPERIERTASRRPSRSSPDILRHQFEISQIPEEQPPPPTEKQRYKARYTTKTARLASGNDNLEKHNIKHHNHFYEARTFLRYDKRLAFYEKGPRYTTYYNPYNGTFFVQHPSPDLPQAA